jgi:predicted permease
MLVAGQVALSLVLLVAAAMFGSTMANLRAVELGFAADGVLTMSLDPLLRGEDAALARERFWRQALERVRALPDVRAASLSVLTPMSGRDTGKSVSIAGFRPPSEEDLKVRVNHVSEDYFRTFDIRLLAGRAFTAADDQAAPKVALINESAARAYFAGQSPLGATIGFGGGRDYTVVGVVRDHKHRRLQEAAPRFVFVPLWQRLDPATRISLAVASGRPPAGLARAVANEVVALQPNTLVSDVLGMQEQIDATLIGERLLSVLASAFAGLALLLAAVGLYGVLSYSVARRHAELGVRLALGASPARVAGGVLRGVLLQTAAGMAIGLPLAFATARAAAGLLYGVTPSSPASYLLAAGTLAAVACLAAWLPARRACSIDPSEALRRG